MHETTSSGYRSIIPLLKGKLSFFDRLSLRYKIISLVITAIILPAILLGLITTVISRRVIRTSIFNQQREIVNRVADRINAQLDLHLKLLQSNSDIWQSPQPQQVKAAREILRQGSAYTELSLMNSFGQTLWSCSPEGFVPGAPARGGGRRLASTLTGQSYISKVFFTRDRHPYLMITVPLSNRSGVLTAKLDFEQVWQWISEVNIGETGYAFIVDREGNLIAHPEPERVFAHSNFSDLPVVRDFLDNRQVSPDRWSEYRDERGRKVVALYRALPRMGWAVVTQIPAREVYQPIRKMRQSILLWTLFWTALFLVIGFRSVQRIVGPLSLLKDGVRRISQGKMDLSLDIHTGDELEDLAGSFEKMAGDLKQLEDMRQDLIRMIIHDLKSPLSGIMGGLDYLGAGYLGELNEDQRKIVSLARKSSETMLVMVQNLLDVAKMEEGKLELRRESADLAALLTERHREFEHLAAHEKKKLTLDVPKGVPPVAVDRQLIERVVNNLVTNALNHTSAGGAITLSLRLLVGAVEVSISDDGVGIPQEYLDKIFEKFVQVNRKQAHLRTGAGLGLTFCKMAVEAHGGTIRVESEPGQGSSFIFTLPS